MSNYLTEHTVVADTEIFMIYPAPIGAEALTGVVSPPVTNDFEFKVRVSKGDGQKLWRVILMERNENLASYTKREFYRCLTKAGALRKADRLVARGVNMGGVL